MIDNIRKEVLEYVNDLDITNEVCTVFDNHITELKNNKKEVTTSTIIKGGKIPYESAYKAPYTRNITAYAQTNGKKIK